MKDFFLDIADDYFDKPFRYKQLIQAVFSEGLVDFTEISTIPAHIRHTLSETYLLCLTDVAKKLVSADGTCKFLFRLPDGEYIESVFLIDKNNRVTFCISSQIGCRMGCIFCQTGKMGLIRNLTSYEILSQVIYLYHYMRHERHIDDRLFNIVFMGMGEPLDNVDEVTKSIALITNPSFFGLSASRITISTSGLMDRIEPFLSRFSGIRIAVSLNSAIDTSRTLLMPVTKKFNIQTIHDTLESLYKRYKTRFTLEYVLISGENDTDHDIEALKMFRNEAFHINIIPLNHSDNVVKRPEEDNIRRFMTTLTNLGFCVTRRYRRGDDIKADCGQLYYAHTNEAGR